MEQRAVPTAWVDIGFDVFAVALFSFAIALMFITRKTPAGRRTGDAAALIFGGAFCALMGNPDRFATIKFTLTGVEASARQAIQEVQVSVEQLRHLATSLAEVSLNDLAFSGAVFVGMSTAEKFRIRDQIVDRLKEIGVSDQDILKAQTDWRYFYCDILEGRIEARMHELLPNIDVAIETKSLPKGSDLESLPSPTALRNWVASHNITDPAVLDLLQGYEKVWTTGAINNPALIPFGSHPRPGGQ